MFITRPLQSDVKVLERQNEGLMSQLRDHEKRERGLRDKEEDLSNAIMVRFTVYFTNIIF